MANDRILYRTESFSGSGVYDIRKIIEYEICTLGNTDVLDYCIDNYKFDSSFKKSLVEFRNFVENINGVIEDLDDIAKIGYSYYIIDRLVDEVSKLTGKKIKYGLWLAELDAVQELYLYDCEEEEWEIDAYEISDVVFSDLGDDGKLFGYEEIPAPICQNG